ncbi:TPA: transcription antitermination factor NusB [Candidatus Sumerlaeota bacterium]|nr:transcription antitermination factor NusB [Candidatus Sumerlaeota bacterium]
MGNRRHLSRQLAVQILYAAQFLRDLPLAELYIRLLETGSVSAKNWTPFCRQLVEDTLKNAERFDAEIAAALENWRIERLSVVDHSLLRLALCEMETVADVPVRVTTDEYIELAKDFSSDESAAFINGVLDRLGRRFAHKDFMQNKTGKKKPVPVKGKQRMGKIFDKAADLAERIQKHKEQGRRVVFANGCFDVVHGGHISYLEEARTHGDVLVVGLNNDASVRRLKGSNRPICTEEERALVLESFRCVDYVVLFPEDTCENLLRTLQPHVHAKGTDYSVDKVPEKVVSDELGIETVITGAPKENATKTIIQKATQF